MRAVNVVVSCSSRKRYEAPKELTARDLPTVDVERRVREWCRRLKKVEAPRYTAANVYIGDQWSIARGLPAFGRPLGFDVRIWICSAGYGLISQDTRIKPYAATFSPGTDDLVTPSGVRDDAKVWWAGVSSFNTADPTLGPRSIQMLCEQNRRTPMLIALSQDYLDAVSGDILEALQIPYFKEHLAIVSCGSSKQRSTLKDNLVPCDASLSNAVGGALTSLNIRIVRQLLAKCNGNALSLDYLHRAIESIPSTRRPARVINPKTDDEVSDFIRLNLAKDRKVSASALLRRYRDAGHSCEQKRFGELFKAQIRMEAA